MSGSPRTRPDYRSLFPARTGFSSFLNTLRFHAVRPAWQRPVICSSTAAQCLLTVFTDILRRGAVPMIVPRARPPCR